MFDLGGGELLLIGIVALIVVGPKDLPTMFRAVGQFTGKARAMAREFTSAMNNAADQSGMSEINKTIRAASKPLDYGADRLREAAGLKPAPMPPKPFVAKPAAAPAVPAPVAAAPTILPGSETAKLADAREQTRARLAEEAAARRAKAEAAAKAVAAAPAATVADQPAVAKPAKPRKSARTPDPAGPAVEKPVKPAKAAVVKAGTADAPAAKPRKKRAAKPTEEPS